MASVHPIPSLGEYLQIANRHRWTIVVTLLVAVLGGGAYVWLAPPQYQSHAAVLVQPTGAEEISLTQGRTKSEINLDTEAQLVTSTQVAALAAKKIPGDSPALTDQVTVSVPANTSILDIEFTAHTPQAARTGAAAFAAAYLDHRNDSARHRLDDKSDSAQAELTDLRQQQSDLSQTLSTMKSSDPSFQTIKKQRDTLDGDIAELSSYQGEVNTAANSVSAGKVVSKPDTPSTAAFPNVVVVVASAAGIGLLLGIGLAVARYRYAVHIWQASDLPRRCDLNVLATLPRGLAGSATEMRGPFGPLGRVFGKLCHEITATVDARKPVIVVANVSAGAASSVVAAHLGVAMASGGDRTIVVSAHPGTTTTVSTLLDASAVPGLSDVFAERASLPQATHPAARQQLLEVMGPGGCANAGGLSREAVSKLYRKLRQHWQFVVIDAAPMSVTADAQLLAAKADAVLLAVECGRDTVAEVADAVQAIRRVKVPLLGAVVLPSNVTAIADESQQSRSDTPQFHSADDRPTETLPIVVDSAEAPREAASVGAHEE